MVWSAVVVSSLPFSPGGVFHPLTLKGPVSRMVFYAAALCRYVCLSYSSTWPFCSVSSICRDNILGLECKARKFEMNLNLNFQKYFDL